MSPRSALITASAALALSVVLASSAQAKSVELVDRSLFDATPERTASTLHLQGPTSGPLGGAMTFTATATDGTLPSAPGACELVDVTAEVTVSPGELLMVKTGGEACAHIVDGSLTINAGFGRKDVTYSGTEHKSAKLDSEGLLAAAHHWYGGQASFSGSLRW